jgi:prepilin-type N-terminal cleavage/methylation domain-containing protein
MFSLNHKVAWLRKPANPIVARRAFTLLELLVVIAIIAVLIGLILPAVQKVRAAGYRTECRNKLRQIGLALHQYHDSQGTFPAGVSFRNNKDPHPHLSWLAKLLPYVEQDELWRLTQQAYLQDRTAWDNPPHVGFDSVIPLFTCPADSRTESAQESRGFHVALTSYLGCEGLNLNTRDGVLYLDSHIRMADIRDGTSKTIMVGERPPGPDFWYGWWYTGYVAHRLGRYGIGCPGNK